jgi:hypothetical protein
MYCEGLLSRTPTKAESFARHVLLLWETGIFDNEAFYSLRSDPLNSPVAHRRLTLLAHPGGPASVLIP